MKLTLENIQSHVEGLAGKILAPKQVLPTYGQSMDGARPHIEIGSNDQLYYVIIERGEEVRRDLAVDLDDLLYKIFADVTFQMAVRYELGRRIYNEDSRRQLFAKQEELLGNLSPRWKERQQKEHAFILRRNPFDDFSNTRADYSQELRNKGTVATQALEETCNKYPLPKTN